MRKILFISGSPRSGNTEFLLKNLFQAIKSSDKELLLLREKNIKRCTGCLLCDKTKTCVINDDMQEICAKITEADLVVLGSPNYFDNVPGLLKDFIDRTNPLYKTGLWKNKRLISIITGGGKIINSKRVANQAIKYFADCHELKYVGSYFFRALGDKDLKNSKYEKSVGKTLKKINSL